MAAQQQRQDLSGRRAEHHNKNSGRAQAKDIYDLAAGYYSVIIDTCSLIKAATTGNVFWQRMIPALQLRGARIKVPYAVLYKELGKIAYAKDADKKRYDKETSAGALAALKQLKELQQLQLLDLVDSKEDGKLAVHADNIILRGMIEALILSGHNIMFITNDFGLTCDIYAVNFSRSNSFRNKVVVCRIASKNGELFVSRAATNAEPERFFSTGNIWYPRSPEKICYLPEGKAGNSKAANTAAGPRAAAQPQRPVNRPQPQRKAQSAQSGQALQSSQPKPQSPVRGQAEVKAQPLKTAGQGARRQNPQIFAWAREVNKVQGEIEITAIPAAGDVVEAHDGQRVDLITLGDKIASGGEGTVYATNIRGLVAKIYKPGKLDLIKLKKLELMISRHLIYPGICFPLSQLYFKGSFAGFLMPEAKGRPLQRSLFLPVKVFVQRYPEWTRLETVQLALTILDKICWLHQHHIIMGDINPGNILISSPTEVYFVDADSYQVEGYPCPMGTINFTAPEIQRRSFADFLRTLGNENFAVATLLFMLMIPGKPPYAMQGGEDQIENILNGDFAYPSGERSNGKAPDGLWRFCWSHLPRFLKDDFYDTFKKGERYSREDTRLNAREWRRRFENYLELLQNGQLTAHDEMSLEIFPTRLKKNKDVTYIKCQLCGEEVDEERSEGGYCYNCLNQGETYPCERCGAEIFFSNRARLLKHLKKPRLCHDCHEALKQVYCTVQCVDCGRTFEITVGQKEQFEQKHWQLPVRCPQCRQQRKSGAANGTHSAQQAQPANQPGAAGAPDLRSALSSVFGMFKQH
ncbi:MAG: zinc-ribbon domain containing protein [Proteobacteria bacterium]|uniref:Zinc-ribbon domain containing protein n=1 Tax=Candidatus Avisuccinivibrio stercorigallinarum TaxID=2840704 RepID=A0A9D9DFQ7_9GAMM|nr:zinc-ribbon domain containing protein [Candidatus Avisuccinivibrio stercorigallinarum]